MSAPAALSPPAVMTPAPPAAGPDVEAAGRGVQTRRLLADAARRGHDMRPTRLSGTDAAWACHLCGKAAYLRGGGMGGMAVRRSCPPQDLSPRERQLATVGPYPQPCWAQQGGRWCPEPAMAGYGYCQAHAQDHPPMRWATRARSGAAS